MLVLDALDYAFDGAITRRAIQLHDSLGLSMDALARVLAVQFDLDLSHRTIVRWLNGLEYPAKVDVVATQARRAG